MTVSEIYLSLKERFTEAGIPEADNNARLLLEHFCDVTRHDLIIKADEEIGAEKLDELEKAAVRRINREPLQYIIGKTNFMGLDFAVDGRVLIPRPDTEILVEEALKNLNDGSRILDLCTGSGCILISLINYSNDCIGTGVDISGDALDVAQQNAKEILKEKNNIRFLKGDLFDPIEEGEKYEVIVSNPPYIATAEIDSLMPEVRDHEPMNALDGSGSGLVFYERIIPEAKRFLTVGGQLLLEIGYDQGEAVSEIMKKEGYLEVNIIKDFAGLDRVVTGIKSVYL